MTGGGLATITTSSFGRILIAIAAMLGGVASQAGCNSAPPEPAPAAKKPVDLSLDDMKTLAKEDPIKLMQVAREAVMDEQMTEAQREKLMENMRRVWEDELDRRVGEYQAAAEAEREAVLNRHVDEIQDFQRRAEAWRKELEEKAGGEKQIEKERERWRTMFANRSREQRKADSETRDPNRFAQRMAYFAALGRQMSKRGIDMSRMRFGGGNRPAGGGSRGS